MANRQGTGFEGHQKPWASINTPTAPVTPNSAPQALYETPRTLSGGWASVNQVPINTIIQRPSFAAGNGHVNGNNHPENTVAYGYGNVSTHGHGHERVNASPAVNGPPRIIDTPEGNRSPRARDRDRSKENTAPEDDESSEPMIDRMPRSKQRQVFALVTGLQSGISRLQSELDSLKKTLGIDSEEII